MHCPRCEGVLLDNGACRVCGGAWYAEADVRERLGVELEFSRPQRTKLLCPSCNAPMVSLELFNVWVDSCEPHGLWFDADEFAEVKRRSGTNEWRLYGGGGSVRGHIPPQPEAQSTVFLSAIVDWLRRKNEP